MVIVHVDPSQSVGKPLMILIITLSRSRRTAPHLAGRTGDGRAACGLNVAAVPGHGDIEREVANVLQALGTMAAQVVADLFHGLDGLRVHLDGRARTSAERFQAVAAVQFTSPTFHH